MPPADNMPDFDSMSPDEIMAWMETLAKRQGVSEGLTTAADAEIAEIDPNTAVVTGPGYTPFEESKKPAGAAAAPSTPPQPVRAEPVRQEPARQELPREQTPAPEPPVRVVASAAPELPGTDEAATISAPAVETDGLAWLEQIAADQDDSLFNLDLSSFDAQLNLDPGPEEEADPVSWLEALARDEEPLATRTPDAVAEADAVPDALIDDPLTWLESLALRQGANPDELITEADLQLPRVSEDETETPAYTPYTFETPQTRRSTAENPVSFLQSLTENTADDGRVPLPTDAPPAAALDMDSITRALRDGTVTPEQMQVWMDHQADTAMAQPDDEPAAPEPAFAFDDPDAPAIPGELPDWILANMPSTPAQAPAAQGTVPLEALFGAQADTVPDWINEDLTASSDMEPVFASAEQPAEAALPVLADDEFDDTDPWVEAFEQEQRFDDEVPAWYTQNTQDPTRIRQVEQLAGGAGEPEPLPLATAGLKTGLSDAALPMEVQLPIGEAEPMPDWMGDAQAAAAEVTADEAPLPNWIDAIANTTDENPWIDADFAAQPDFAVAEADFAEAVFEPVAPAVPPPAPVRRPEPPRAVMTGATLQSARARTSGGDVTGGLAEYEALIRARVDLDDVVTDLRALAGRSKAPALYRLLGDGYMRQGRLQDALDTYREALNHL
jgi:hypothetical protein